MTSPVGVADAAAAAAATRPPSSPSRVGRGNNNNNNDFSLEHMPSDRIVKRSPYPWSVHHSLTTSNWIATIARPVENTPQSKTRHTQFVFSSEREARKFCQAYAPPKLVNQPYCQGTHGHMSSFLFLGRMSLVCV